MKLKRDKAGRCMRMSFYQSRYDAPPMQQRPTTSTMLTRSAKQLLVLLLVAFVWLQFAGVVHKYVHSGHAPSAHALSAHAEQAAAPLAQVFLAHDGQNQDDKTCQLFDLACADLSLVQAVAVLPTAPLVAHLFSFLPRGNAAAQTHAYLARAPPALI